MTRVGDYELGPCIGRGGMAIVYVGRRVGTRDLVVVKTIRDDAADNPDFRDMFIDEVRLARHVDHPNVVRSIDVVDQGQTLALVMEYVHGEALGRLPRRDVPRPIAIAIAVAVANGLHASHVACDDAGHPLGIVHRDVSPDNVMIGESGVVKVIDFGVAKAARKLHRTREGKVKGRVAYMAPEQLFASPDVGPAADIFSASIVLWELLTGTRLFGGKMPMDIAQVLLDGTIEAPSAYVPSVPPALDAVVARGLARAPADRFATAEEMARALSPFGAADASAMQRWLRESAQAALDARAAAIRAWAG